MLKAYCDGIRQNLLSYHWNNLLTCGKVLRIIQSGL